MLSSVGLGGHIDSIAIGLAPEGCQMPQAVGMVPLRAFKLGLDRLYANQVVYSCRGICAPILP